MSDLRLGDESRPYYLGYTIYDLEQASVNATLGALTASHAYRGRILRTDLRVGDPELRQQQLRRRARASRPCRSRTTTRPCGASSGCAPTRPTRRRWRRWRASGPRRRGRRPPPTDEAAVGDFSKEAASHLEVPFPAGGAEPEALRETARKLSSVLADFPEISSSRVSASYAIVRRRLISSEGTFVDDNQRTVQIDVVAETQAPDGMKLRSFVPFTALIPTGLPALGRDGEVGPRDGQGTGRRCGARRSPRRARAPCCSKGWRRPRSSSSCSAIRSPARRRPRPRRRGATRGTIRGRWPPSSGRRSRRPASTRSTIRRWGPGQARRRSTAATRSTTRGSPPSASR